MHDAFPMECTDWLGAQPWLERLSADHAPSHVLSEPVFRGILACHVAAGDQYGCTASTKEEFVALQFARADQLEVSLKLLKAEGNCTLNPPRSETTTNTDEELESTSGILLEMRETVFLLKTKHVLRVESGESALPCPLCSLSQDSTSPLSEECLQCKTVPFLRIVLPHVCISFIAGPFHNNNMALKETCGELDRLQALLHKLKLQDAWKHSKQPRFQVEDSEQLSESQQKGLRTWIQASQNMCGSAMAAKAASCCTDTSLMRRLLSSMAQQNRIAAGSRERMVQRITHGDSLNILDVRLSDSINRLPLKEGLISHTAAIWHSSPDSVATLSQKRQKVAKAREAFLLSQLFPDLIPKPPLSADAV